jgi:hypothetical protein
MNNCWVGFGTWSEKRGSRSKLTVCPTLLLCKSGKKYLLIGKAMATGIDLPALDTKEIDTQLSQKTGTSSVRRKICALQ